MKNMDPSSILQATPSEPTLLCTARDCRNPRANDKELCLFHLEKDGISAINQVGVSQQVHVCVRSLCENPPAPGNVRCAYHVEETKDAIAERRRKKRLWLCCYAECYEPRFENEKKCKAHLENPGNVCSTDGCYNPVPENRKICLYHAERARENHVIRAQRARERGVCVEGRCNEPSAPGILRCPKHAKRRNEANKSYRHEALTGIRVCSYARCKELPVGNKMMCKRHASQVALQNRKHRENRRAAGLCIRGCNKPLAPGSKLHCLEHLTEKRERNRKSARMGRLRLNQEKEELENDQRSENTDAATMIGVDDGTDLDMAMDICSDAGASAGDWEDDARSVSQPSFSSNRPAEMRLSFICN